MDKRIVEFIKEHHLLTLATSENNTPYCCNVFYIYNEENNSLIFSSETSTCDGTSFKSVVTSLTPSVETSVSEVTASAAFVLSSTHAKRVRGRGLGRRR